MTATAGFPQRDAPLVQGVKKKGEKRYKKRSRRNPKGRNPVESFAVENDGERAFGVSFASVLFGGFR